MKNYSPEKRVNDASSILKSLLVRHGVLSNRHEIRNVLGEIDILTTAEVVAQAKGLLRVVQFPPEDVDAVARDYVAILNSAFPNFELGVPSEMGYYSISHLIGYAYILSQVQLEAGGQS